MTRFEGKKICLASGSVRPGFVSGIARMILPALLFCGSLGFAQTGVNTDFPDASSAMEVYATNKGLLIPRVTLTSSLNNPSPVTSPAVGLLVFNNGPNQAMGFYYWSGSQWTSTGAASPSGDYWSLTGNTGTTPGTNFIGTIDTQDFLIFTDESERIRVESDGQVIIGNSTPFVPGDMFTVVGKTGMDNAINAYSPDVGFYADADRIGLQTVGGKYGLAATLDSNIGFAVYGKNTDPLGYGMIAVGSNAISNAVQNHSSGLMSNGDDGLIARGQGVSKTGIIATGNNLTDVTTLGTGSGAAFAGYHGTYTLATNTAAGIGVIGVGNNFASYATLPTGCGGAFTGYHGIYGIATNVAGGTGVIGVGNYGANIAILATGSGGAFTGRDGVYAKAVNNVGTGIIAIGNNYSGQYMVHPNGTGGAFTGYHGIVSLATNVAGGTGVIGVGNNAGYTTLAAGSGGAFNAVYAGAVGWASNTSTGVGVIGNGNGVNPVLPATGCGGAFTATVCGVSGYATNGSNDRYGGYFATNGTLYAYVGGRYSSTNRKIVGTGTVSTIVKDTQGKLITLTCPEAPEIVFQDYGIGQLVDGRAYIKIDPDLAININVDNKHPLKVYITPEGDCNGVYVTNKSADGFDVIELMGGTSDVAFAWQIVATRANEVNVLKDGTTEVSDNSQRFQPAPGPLENYMPATNTGDQSSIRSAETRDVTLEKPVSNPVIFVDDPTKGDK